MVSLQDTTAAIRRHIDEAIAHGARVGVTGDARQATAMRERLQACRTQTCPHATGDATQPATTRTTPHPE